MRLRTLILLGAVVLPFGAPVPARAQASVDATGRVPVAVNLDASTFAFDASRSLVEVYLAFEARTLPFRPAASGSGFEAALPLDLAIVPSSDFAQQPAAAWADSTTLRFSIADTLSLGDGRQFIHVVRAAVAPGSYELRVTIPPAVFGRELTLRRDLRVPEYGGAAPALSEPTLATSIQAGGQAGDPFVKNGLVVRPNPTLVFGQTLSQLWYYAEAYRPGGAVSAADTAYTLYAYITDANRPQPVAGLEKRLRRRVRATDVVVNGFDLRRLPSGVYYLRLAMLGENNEAVAEQQRRFFVYNPSVQAPAAPVADLDFESSPYVSMPEDEVTRSLAHVESVLAERERRRARAVSDLDSRRRFLWEFWSTRDPNPATALNEYKDEFYRRLQYANDRYSRPGREGWQTDRGRAILKYGQPSQVEPHLYDREMKAHEIWTYTNIPGEGQATFVFGDRNGFGEFEQLHSTVAGERSVGDWQMELQK